MELKVKPRYTITFAQHYDICYGRDRAFLVVRNIDGMLESSMEVDPDIDDKSLSELIVIGLHQVRKLRSANRD